MKNHISEIKIEGELSKFFDTYVNASFNEETKDDLIFIVKITKPHNYDLYKWLDKEIGYKEFIIKNNNIILNDCIKIEIVNKLISKIKELDPSTMNFIIIPYPKGLSISWDQCVPF